MSLFLSVHLHDSLQLISMSFRKVFISFMLNMYGLSFSTH